MKQLQKVHPTEGHVPERALVEVKDVEEDARATAKSDQVRRFRLLRVTNLRNSVLTGADGSSGRAKLKESRLAGDTDDLWSKVKRPRRFARDLGAGLGENCCWALARRVALAFSEAPFHMSQTAPILVPSTPARLCSRRQRSPDPTTYPMLTGAFAG